MRIEDFSFGFIRIDGTVHEHDVVIDRGKVSKRKKKASKKFRVDFGHTPLSLEEEIPWKCRRLVVGRGLWCTAGHERGAARSRTANNQVDRPADAPGNRSFDAIA
jgi:hypothetical protein